MPSWGVIFSLKENGGEELKGVKIGKGKCFWHSGPMPQWDGPTADEERGHFLVFRGWKVLHLHTWLAVWVIFRLYCGLQLARPIKTVPRVFCTANC